MSIVYPKLMIYNYGQLSVHASAPRSQDDASFKLYFFSKPRDNAPQTYSYLQQIEFSYDQSVNDFYKKLVVDVTVDMSKEFKEFPRPAKSPTGLPILSKPFLLKTN